MSIASEISRLSSNISDSLDAVAAKGVTVPSDSNSDDLPGLIALIEQSSGGDSGGTIYQDLDGYLHLSEDDKNVISIVDTLDTAGGTIRTITSTVENPVTYSDMANAFAKKEITGDIVLDSTVTQFPHTYFMSEQPIISFRADRVTGLPGYAFQNCTSLKTISFPSLETLYAACCFMGCSSLTMVCFPKLGTTNRTQYFYTQTFRDCTSLEVADLSMLGRTETSRGLSTMDFMNCTNLKTLILRKTNGVCYMGNVNTFQGSAFDSTGTGGTLYVPSALISSYQSATNWSTILGYTNNQIKAIEGSIYETQYADGTPIT